MPESHESITSAELQQVPARHRICTCFEDLFHLIISVRELSGSQSAQPVFATDGAGSFSNRNDSVLFHNADRLRSRVLNLFERAFRDAKSAGYSDTEIDDAGFAVAAFLDEAVSVSRWDQKDSWKLRNVSAVLFKAEKIGDEFYRRLDRLVDTPGEVLDVIEVYYLCIAIGFKGKYGFETEKLDPIQSDLFRLLDKSAVHRKSDLSLDASSGRSAFSAIQSEAPPWYGYGTALILVILMWLTARYFAV